jgi:translation initiation factor 2B subunit (eIF-2B alpha/beta/delta family)
VVNLYFETVPLNLVSLVVGEDGPYDPRGAAGGQ